jgi:hypothetical protein
MNTVFVDSVGLLALWNSSDQWHDPAKNAFAQINDGRTRLVTTTFILLECGNAASRTPFRADARAAQEQFEKAGTLIWPTETDWKLAWQNYQRELWITFHSRSCGGWALPKHSPTTGIFAPPDLKTCFERSP